MFMKSWASSSASRPLKVLPPRGFPDVSDVAEGSDIELPLMEKKSPLAKSTWSADAADLFILLCSFLLTATSVAFVTLVFDEQAAGSSAPSKALPILQRIISSLSVTITSAVILVAGKRYVLFKLTRGGLRSRRVAIYSNPSIGNLVSYLMLYGAELPLLGLSAVWGLALATGLTVNNSWEMGSISSWMDIGVPSGPLNAAPLGSSWLMKSSDQLAFAMSSLCIGFSGTVGLVNITSTNMATDYPMGTIYYPPLLYVPTQDTDFSFSTMMNGFNLSMESLSLIPPTAQNLTCAPSAFSSVELWSDGSDDQTLSIIVVDSTGFSDGNSIFRFNATAIIVGGTLSSSDNHTEFAPNGTSWPNVMPGDSQWAQDITSLICNATSPLIGKCSGSSFLDFAMELNVPAPFAGPAFYYRQWSTVLGMALGAYTSAVFLNTEPNVLGIPFTWHDVQFTSRYEIYILILNIIVSVVMLVVVLRLRLASHLGADFINSTRLLLDPLDKPGFFNASLTTTVNALGDPYMLVGDDRLFVLAGQRSTEEGENRTAGFSLWRRWRNPFDRTL